METYKYSSIYNYLFSEWPKKYKDVVSRRLYLTNTNDPIDFEPSNGYFVKMSDCADKFINSGDSIIGLKSQDGVHTETELKGCELITDSDPTGIQEATGSYEELLDIPAYTKASACPFIAGYAARAQLEAQVNSGTLLTYEEACKAAFPWSEHYDEEEYDKFSIPTTDLNQDTVCLIADKITVSAREKFDAKGALLTLQIEDKLFPVEFMYWTSPGYYHVYEFDWNPNGIVQLK